MTIKLLLEYAKEAVAMKITSRSSRKWFTALMFSPGMIFASAYLLVWLSMNLWLDHTFKGHLEQVFISEAGQRFQIDIGSLRSGADLNSLMLKKLELTPIGGAENLRTNRPSLEIAELQIECPDLSFFPFRPADEMPALRKVCRKILSNSPQ
ncbi:hypothetical protein EST62_02535 [Chlorobaculum sp. 24CR]|jgi:hypothetical protein|uniref:hypothetical protein n=1 Tax=Chlorobaculum sp. 24CR TaxID=2508878 RepID=UPI00100BB700|nr:hypothetical protein [Chlorobaculum sp. 24CR]RXK88537.1 hypothetical protein EST62_02535 [Chlorobaculum sp. 24CR]